MTEICSTHTWEQAANGAPIYGCTQCPEITHACHTCNTPMTTANLACHGCLDHAHRTLDSIREAADTPYAFQLGIQATRYDRDITSGTPTHDPRGSTPDRDDITELGPLAEATNVNVLTILRDPPNVLEPILDWAHMWATHRGETLTDTNVFDYLTSRLTWAANNPDTSDWHQYRTEARTIRTRLRRLVGLSDKTVSTPCTHCGGQIIQRNGDHGLEDHLTCTGCGTTWGDRELLNLTNLNHYRDIPHHRPDTLVTPDDARRMIPTLKRNTLNVWIKRRLIEPALTPDGTLHTNQLGQPLYRIGDIANRHKTPA